ncbi:MAG: hypothetical protein JXB08_05670 [Bacilli bacterium]|nr:hypothetical protein [Bacilli bacterium]MBN2876608.1 hypothetical protein [Bacilli bacterium]
MEVGLLLVVLLLLIAVASFFIIRDLKLDLKQVYKIRSRFHIEIRKISNLIYNVHSFSYLEPFTKVIIKNLPHEEKRILLRFIDRAYEEIDHEDETNKYILETYENLQELRRARDAKILVYNQKLVTFPFSLYVKILKMQSYELYTEKE